MRTFCILLCLALAPMYALAAFEECEPAGAVGPPDFLNSYVAYNYSTSGGTCTAVTQLCNATVLPDTRLRGRTWFVDDIKKFDALGYDNSFIQVYKFQCPQRSVLHLYLQDLDTEEATPCSAGDFISVTGDDFEREELCGNFSSDMVGSSRLQNGGLGRIFGNGTAQVEFCSDGDDERGNGFVLRASCLDLNEWNLPGCVDYATIRAWDPEFLNDNLDRDFVKPARVPRPHKRSAEKKARMTVKKAEATMKHARSKRFANYLFVELGPMDVVTYMNRIVTVEFGNGTIREYPEIDWFYTHSMLTDDGFYTTRLFDFNSPFSYMGPGSIEFYGKLSWVKYTVMDLNDLPQVLPSPEVQARVNQIYDYIYDCYVRPYPIIVDDLGGNPKVFPLPGDDSKFLNANIQESYVPGWVHEDIQSGFCRRAVRTDIAPAKQSKFDDGILNICRFFWNACDLTLRTACREALLADPRNFVGK